MNAKYNIELGFSGKVSDEIKNEIIEQLMTAIKFHNDECGLTPDDCDEMVETISIYNTETNNGLSYDLLSNTTL